MREHPDQVEWVENTGIDVDVGCKREVFIQGNTVRAGLQLANRSRLVACPDRPRTVRGMREQHLERKPIQIPIRRNLSTTAIDALLASTCLDPDSPHAEGIAEAIRQSSELASALSVLVEGGWTALPAAASTRRTNGRSWSTFEKWCSQHEEVSSLPATALTVHRFLDERTETASARTIRNYVTAISQEHRAYGLPDPTEHPIIEVLVETTRRLAGKGTHRDPAALADLHSLVDSVDHGGYWSGLSDSSTGRRQSKGLLRRRWRALMTIEWAGSLSARDGLLAHIDDLVFEPTFSLRLAPTIHRPDGISVPIARYSNPTYDPVEAMADWLEAAGPFLPECGHIFPTVLARALPVVICGVCSRIEAVEVSPDGPISEELTERAVAEAVRQDSIKFNRIAAGAGLRTGNRMVTRDSLRLGAAYELTLQGISPERVRRQKRTTQLSPVKTPNGQSLERLAQIAQDLTR